MSNFQWAMDQIKNRRKVTREDWYGAIYVSSNSNNVLYSGGVFENKDVVLMGWLPNSVDIFADDWVLFSVPITEPVPVPKPIITQDTAILRSWEFIQKWEGGSAYTNDPRDPGGPTKWGVALNYNKDVIPDKNNDGVINAEDVKLLDEADGLAIFILKYWNPCKCGLLPIPVGFVYSDMCYNIGQGRSPKLLQECCNKFTGIKLTVDGIIGEKTIKACETIDQATLVKKLSADRLAYYKTRSNWPIYGKGWTNRTNDCEAEALKLI